MHRQARRILRPFIFARKTLYFTADRKIKWLRALKPKAHALAIAGIMGLFLMGTTGSASAQDTTPPMVPSEFAVTLKSEAGPEPTPPDGVLSACIEANEGFYANLSCPGDKTISSIDFAGYGQPAGSCSEGYSAGSCHASDSRSIIEAMCLNRSECAVSTGNDVFGDPCPDKPKRIAITYTCSSDADAPYPTQFWNFPTADHSVEQVWAELPNRMFTDIENFQGNQDPPFTWQTHTPGPFLELTEAGLELSWDPNADKSAFPTWLQRRSELTEPFTTSVVPGTTNVFAMRFEVNNLPGPLTGPVTIFQRFRDDLDRPDLDVELAKKGQFPDAEPNSVLVHAAGEPWIRPNVFLKGPGQTNDLVVAVENKEGGAYRVSLNGQTIAQGTGNFAPATPTTFTAPKFGIYNHGGHQEYFKFTHKKYGRYTYNRTPDFNLINSVNITQ